MPEGWDLVGSSGFARVACDEQRRVFYKEFLPRSPLETLKGLLRGSRATRARRHNDELRAEGFEAPRNLLWDGLPGGREYLFSSAVAGRGITDWLREELTGRDRDSLRLRRQLLRQLGDFIGRLHAAGFIHGDLRPSNALAQARDDGFEFALIDNERNQRSQPPPGKGLLKNLMQLNMLTPADLTLTDRWRFYCAWRRHHPELSDSEARLLALEAWRWAMRRLRAKGKV